MLNLINGQFGSDELPRRCLGESKELALADRLAEFSVYIAKGILIVLVRSICKRT